MFTKVSFFKGDFVLFYRGKRLSEKQYGKLCEAEKAYAFSNDKDMFIDASEKSSGLARYINDSFDKPNCVAKIYRCKNGLPHVMF